MKWNTVHRGIDPEAVAQTFRAAMRRIGNIGLDHHILDDLPDSDTGQIPDRRFCELRHFLRLADAMRRVESIKIVRRHGYGAIDNLLLSSFWVLALLETAKRDGTFGEINSSRGDLDQLGRTTTGIVQRLAEGAVAGRFAFCHCKKCRALLGVQIEAVSGAVIKAHFAHV